MLPRAGRGTLAIQAVLVVVLALGSSGRAAADTRPSVEAAWDWRFITGGRVRYAPAVSQDHTIYCVSDDRWLRAIDLRGREVWRASLAARPLASPVATDDARVFVVTADRAVTVYGAQGRARWRTVLDRAASGAPALAPDGGVYVPLVDGYLAALDARGRTRWTFRFTTALSSPPVVSAGGEVYISTQDRLLHALDREGRELWASALPGVGGATAIGTDGTVYVSAFGIHAFTPDGAPKWDFPVTQPTTDPVVGRVGDLDVVVVAARDGKVHRIDASGGRREEIPLDGQILEPPALRADGIIVVTSSRGVYRVQPDSPGAAALRVAVSAGSTRPVLSPDGIALVGSEDWVLTAMRFGDGSVDGAAGGGAPWPQPRSDGGNGGRPAPVRPSRSYLVLVELARSTEVSHKERVLSDIRGQLEGRSWSGLGADEMVDLLVSLAREGATSTVYVDEGPAGDNPALRAAAAALLGEVGTRAARSALIAVVERDPRPEVQSSAAAALGRVGYDPDGEGGRALGELARKRRTDTRLLAVVVRALGQIAAASGPSLGLGDAGGQAWDASLAARPAWEALVGIATGQYPGGVREAARAELRGLTAPRGG